MKKLLCFCLSLLILSAVVAYAHNGRTDYKGGHYDSETSEYHYHHGYPAHNHVNGECPYDFKNRVVSNSSSVSVSTPAPSAVPTQTQKPKSSWQTVLSGIAFLVNGILVYVFLNIRFASKYAKETAKKAPPLKIYDEQLVQTPPVSSKPTSQIYELYERNGTIIHLPKNGSKQFVNVSYKKSTLLHTATPLTTYEHFVLERQYQTYLQEKAYYEYLFDRSPEELAGVPEGVNPAMAFMSNEIWAIYYRNIITVMRYYGIKPKVKTIQLPPSQTEHNK